MKSQKRAQTEESRMSRSVAPSHLRALTSVGFAAGGATAATGVRAAKLYAPSTTVSSTKKKIVRGMNDQLAIMRASSSRQLANSGSALASSSAKKRTIGTVMTMPPTTARARVERNIRERSTNRVN